MVTGNAFDPATAKRLRDFIYSAGNLRDPAEAYKAFRGRLPAVDALLKKRGLDQPATVSRLLTHLTIENIPGL